MSPLLDSDDAISDAVHACLTDIINVLNEHPHPAIQITAMSTALAQLLVTATGKDLSKIGDVEGMTKDFAERVLRYWQGFASGEFDEGQKIQ